MGRPLKYNTVEELENAIELYFLRCDDGKIPYTVAGLALALGVSTKTLTNYEHAEGYEPFFHTVKMAKQKCEAQMVENALSNKLNPSVAIFLCKANYNYSDQQDKTGQQTQKVIIEFEGDSDK